MAVLKAIALILLGNEIVGQFHRFGRLILHKAINRVPEQVRAQYAMEWPAHFEDCPGILGKFWHACGCWLAAPYVQFDPIGWRERIAYAGAGLLALWFAIHRCFFRIEAGIIIRILILLGRSGISEVRLQVHRRRVGDLVRFTRSLQGFVVAMRLCSRAGLRIGEYAATPDIGRAWLVNFGLKTSCIYIKHMMRHMGDVCFIRRTIGFRCPNKPNFQGPANFERWVVEGTALWKQAKDLASLAKRISELLDLLSSKLEGESLEQIADLKRMFAIS